MNRTHAYWLCQVAGWTLFWGFQLAVHTENWAPGEIQTTLLAWGLRVVLGIGLTHAFRAYARRHGWTRLSLRQLVPRAVVASVVVGALYTVLRLLPVVLGPLRRVARHRVEPPLAWGGVGNVLIVGVWIAIYFGVHAFWNYRQAEVDRWKLQARAESARLEALKLQLNPHFFFNSLASVRALISEAPGRAKKMVTRLARLLRKTLQAGDEEMVPLREELSTTETYLNLEKVRFEGRLDWQIDAPEAALQRPVPFMLVQTLVENAVKHGVGQHPDGGTIQVEARVRDDAPEPPGGSLRLRVTNPGRLDADAGSDRGSGTGLENARERLRLLYGAEASLTLEQSGPEAVTATALLPHPAGAEAAEAPSSGTPVDGTGGTDSTRRAAPPGEGRPQDEGGAGERRESGRSESPPPSAHRRLAPPSEEEGRNVRDDAGDASMTRLLVGPPSYWICQAVAWTPLFAGVILVTTAGQNPGWAELLGIVLRAGFFTATGIGLTHAFRIYAKWQNWTTLPPRRLLPRAGAGAVLLGSTYVLITAPSALAPVDLPAAWEPWLWAVLDEILPAAFAFSALMGMWTAIYFSVHAFWNHRQAEIDRWKLQARAETARLEALKLQLNPHFFFNSLASVRSLITEAPQRARTMVGRLARLLRQALQAGDEKTVPLREELSTTETYLDLEQVRFEERLDWTIDVSEPALQRQVPFMLVQTLVENAVKHGVGQRREGGTIQIEATLDGDANEEVGPSGGDTPGEDTPPLCLKVTNPGRLGEEAGADRRRPAERGSGTGLENARERLRLLFGGEASLTLEQSGPETVTATARIPPPTAREDRRFGDDARPETSRTLSSTVPADAARS